MDRSHELIDQWIGQPVLIQTVTGPNPSQDEIQLLIDNPDEMIFGSVRVSTQMLELVAYDSFGVLLAV